VARPNVTPAVLAQLISQSVRPAIFVQASFQNDTIYVWTGFGNIYWNGHTWIGIGTLGGISTIEEGATISARGITLSLSGIDPTLLTSIMGEFQQGQPVTVYLGFFDASNNLIADPLVSWAGRMDQPTIEMDGSTATIAITCENRLVEMNVAVDRRLTNEDQQLDHPGDRGLEFTAGIIDVMIYWGRSPSSSNNF
jgi:hypothetical protein